VELMRLGVIDNSRKTLDPGKTVTTFCMVRRPPTSTSMTTRPLNSVPAITPTIP
jgi:acyl-CoA hydrolase